MYLILYVEVWELKLFFYPSAGGLKEKNQVNGLLIDGAPALMHRPAAIEVAPSPEKRGEFSHTPIADHTLLLQGRRYPEARDLRRTMYGRCSNSAITCYNRRFLNLQQHSIRRGTAAWATGSTEAMEAVLVDWHQRHVVRVCSALCSLAV